VADAPLVIFASRSRTSYTLINDLSTHFTVGAVVFEASKLKQLLRYRLKTLGWWVVANQLAFVAFDRAVIRRRSRGRIDALLRGYDDSPPDERLRCVDVETVNSPAVRELLAAVGPGCVVVSGTGIIGRKTLAAGPPFLNIHVGITPRYRGVHGGFWAVVEGRPDLAGVTVHEVDAGVDTGGIVAQAAIVVDGDDTFRTLPVKQYIAGLPLMREAVTAVLAGALAPYTRDDLESRQWYSPTFADYARFIRRLPR
jgi:phosphoribosylglycinamide formyltransferase 1